METFFTGRWRSPPSSIRVGGAVERSKVRATVIGLFSPALARLPGAVIAQVAGPMTKGNDLQASNVPGLREDVYVAGRIAGYPQAVLMMVGLVVSLLGVARAFTWYAANASHLSDPQADPITNLTAMWLAMRWAVLGLALFGLGWLWALITSLDILREAKRSEAGGIPPRLK